MDRLAELETFVKVAEAGGIGAAANRMGIAKSAVSRRLKDLEERLGVRLVNRTTRRLSLTETGRAYYERAASILVELSEADQSAAAVHGTLCGRLRLAAPLSFGLLHLAPALAEFMAMHEQLSVDLDLNDRRVDLVDEGFDVAVRIGVLEDSSLIARKLFDMRHVLCASPAYLEKHGTPQTTGDLQHHVGLRYSNLPEKRAWMWRDADGLERAAQLSSRMSANNGEMLVSAAEAGLGLCLQPSFIVYRSIEAGRLVPVLAGVNWRTIGGYALYPPGRHLSAKVRALVDFLAERFNGTPYWDECLEQT